MANAPEKFRISATLSNYTFLTCRNLAYEQLYAERSSFELFVKGIFSGMKQTLIYNELNNMHNEFIAASCIHVDSKSFITDHSC